ncbi:MAG: carbonic anhydrase, partial [Flavobacterium sp.]
LWIGCSDSRVPANEITNTLPGEIFVHRNIANLVINTDMNLLSVLHYAIRYLKIKHIIVCGHYECGGVLAAMSNKKFGFIDNWLSNIKDVYNDHHNELELIQNEKAKGKRLVELNVARQVHNLSKISLIQESWKETGYPVVHGWVYDIADGLIKDLDIRIDEINDINSIFHFEL